MESDTDTSQPRPAPLPLQSRLPPPSRNTLTGLISSRPSQGATPIPPSLQAKMAAVSPISCSYRPYLIVH
jgi:mitogen-activated protein kinase kinase